MSTKKKSGKAASRRTTRAPKERDAVAAVSNGVVKNTYCKKVQHHVDSMTRRLTRQLAKLKSYGLPDERVVTAAQTALGGLTETSHLLAQVPEDWKPLRGTLTTAAIEVGSDVRLKEKYAIKYKGFIDDGAKITVVGLVDRQLKCKTMCDGQATILPLPRSHVQPALASAEA